MLLLKVSLDHLQVTVSHRAASIKVRNIKPSTFPRIEAHSKHDSIRPIKLFHENNRNLTVKMAGPDKSSRVGKQSSKNDKKGKGVDKLLTLVAGGTEDEGGEDGMITEERQRELTKADNQKKALLDSINVNFNQGSQQNALPQETVSPIGSLSELLLNSHRTKLHN